MATAAGSSAESVALRSISTDYMLGYLTATIDFNSFLPAALSAHLISDVQKRDCDSAADSFKRARIFIGHIQRAVNDDSNKYHTFVQVLKETGLASLASLLEG